MDATELRNALQGTASDRAKIEPLPNNAPHYSKIGPGQFIGYRPKGQTWCVRARLPLPMKPGEKAQWVQKYDTLPVLAGAEYRDAVTAAWEWISQQMGRRPRNAPSQFQTVADCCDKYIENLRLIGFK